MTEKKDLLVVGPAWVGDMVMAQSLFIALKTTCPDSACDVIAPAWSVELLKRMPEVRQAYVLNVRHGRLGWLPRWRLAKQIKNNRYQRAIVLPRSFKAALVPFFAGIPVRTGFSSEMRYGLINDLRKLEPRLDQTVKRFVALGSSKDTDSDQIYCPQPSLHVDENNIRSLLEQLNLNTQKPVVGFMPGAEYGPAKQWPVEYFKELAAELTSNDHQVWVFGSEKERSLGETIAGQSNNVINLCGRTSLVDVIDLASILKVAVSNDSGLMHVAAAVDIPIIAIYGSSSPAYTPPLSQKASVESLQLECSPCFKRTCQFGHYACLKDIPVDRILARVYELISTDNVRAQDLRNSR